MSYTEREMALKRHIEELDQRIAELELLLFQPVGESHHDANRCPYCKENLNGKQ